MFPNPKAQIDREMTTFVRQQNVARKAQMRPISQLQSGPLNMRTPFVGMQLTK